MTKSQSASAVLLIRPSSFGFDEQTAPTNTFQRKLEHDSRVEVQQKAEIEFDRLVSQLRRHSIDAVIFDDSPAVPKPSGVFPNNWLTTWPDGTIYFYPMATASRRVERNPEVLDFLKLRFVVDRVEDISGTEKEGDILEGTGAMVFDHLNKIVYASLSPRCSQGALGEHAKALGYKTVAFRSYNENRVPVYHTNVVLSVQSLTAVVCSESITDEAERKLVLGALRETGREVVEITHDQMNQFCGNVIEIQNTQGERFLLMSDAAYRGFTPEQRRVLSRDKTLLHPSIPTIETIGGGSARCMVAEIFLPARSHGPLNVQ